MIKLTRLRRDYTDELMGWSENEVFVNPRNIIAIENRNGEARVYFVGDLENVDCNRPTIRFKESVEEILLLINNSRRQGLPNAVD